MFRNINLYPGTNLQPATGRDEDYVGWGEEVEDDKSAKDSEEVGAVEYVKETLRLPHELDSLEELYEEDILDLTEVLEYYAKWYAKEISTEELEDELQNLYYEPKSRKSKDEPGDEEVQAILNAEFGEDDEDEDEPIGVAV